MLGLGIKLRRPWAALLIGPICWAAALAQLVSATVGNGVFVVLNGRKSVGVERGDRRKCIYRGLFVFVLIVYEEICFVASVVNVWNFSAGRQYWRRSDYRSGRPSAIGLR
jgi:hypothetical protein